FLTYPIWNKSTKNKKWLITFVWYCSIAYIFFFLSFLFVLISNLQPEFLFIFVSNLIIALFLIPSPVFISILLCTLPLSWIIFKYIIGLNTLPIVATPWHFRIIYMWILLGSSLVVISNLRNRYIREKTKTKRLYLEQ